MGGGSAGKHGKEKVAISIDAGLLKRVDARVDGTNVKSRSHAMELLLMKALGGGSETRALVLCGGEKRGLTPSTYHLPRALVEVGGKPILQRTIEWLKANGVKHIVLAIGQSGEEIAAYFKNGEAFGVEIDFVRESKPLGTAGAVKNAEEKMNGTFVVLNGDVLCDFDLRAMLEAHRKSGALATMALKSVRDEGRYGVAETEGEKIVKFEEKAKQKGESRLVNAGVYVLSERIFDSLPGQGMLERDVFPSLARKGLMRGYVFSGKWVDLGDRASLQRAEKELG
ncbi:Bifunctional protein GlmU [Candidatus Burarchaeum australiense]|nr:Bifunctional protein GlmU [Candidatus Burarchaeum australiense]